VSGWHLAVFLPSVLGSKGIVSFLNVAVTGLVALADTLRVGRTTLATLPKQPSA
jgi:hypothetical protein